MSVTEPVGATSRYHNSIAAASPELAALIAVTDWSRTSAGAPERWSQALRTILDVILANRFPVVFWWGPDFIQFYNDPYRAVIAGKHPKALGQSARECWAEIWHIIGPQIESVFQGGPGTWNEDLLLEMNRRGFMEETYFTFSYSALPDPTVEGGIGGVLATVQETTDKVIGERRMQLLRDLAARGSEAKTVDEECLLAAQMLERHAADVPFALLYLFDRSSAVPRLRASCGAVPETLVNLPPVNLSAGVTLIEGPHAAVIAPIPSSAPHEHAGFLIAGVSPRLPFDERYRDFFSLVTSQIGTAIASARAHEEERRRAEALAEIDRAKNVFFSNVSHEFRTPLTLMLGPLSDLSKDADETTRPAIESAHRNALRLLKLVNTLLDFSRIEAGKAEAAFARTDLAVLTEEICGVFRSAIEGGGLGYVVDVRLSEPVYVDRTMWEKIVFNLLSNALKFTLTGEIRVSLKRAGDAAELRVEDTGSGVPSSELPHVFERFRRVRATKSRSHEGSGIGLALVKDLVELHGGTISAESELGAGTTFIVRIPLGSDHLEPASLVSDPASAPHSNDVAQQYLAEVDSTITRSGVVPLPSGGAGRRRRVLVADDNGDLREYLSRVLSRRYDVVTVANGVQALEAARRDGFDVIVSDVMMPEMDGFELLAAVRGDSTLSTTPFIMLSARAGEESAIEGIGRGADDYVPKPFSADDLIARVEANLNAAVLREEAWHISQQQFRLFADRLPVMVWQQDPYGAIVFTNAAWHDITGLPRNPSSYTETAWARVVHPDDFASFMKTLQEGIAGRKPFSFEFRVKHADAGPESYRWYIASAELQYQAETFAGWTGCVVDVHDARKSAELERKLRTETEKRERAFQALAEAAPVIMWSADADGWLDWYNNRWYEYTGQTPEEAAGWGWQAAHHPDDLPRVMQEWPHSIATGERFEMEFRLRRRDGVFNWFLTRAEPQHDETGRVVRWYGSNSNIQLQKEALEQSKRIAETLQGVFLPRALPHNDKVRFDAVYVAAERDALIGGDWFDAVELPDGRFLISVGDVAGHGIDASVIAGTIRQAITGIALTVDDPARILEQTNRILRFQHHDKYATAIVAIVDRDCASLTYASAGHPSPLLARSRRMQAQTLPHGGLALGIEDRIQLNTHHVELERDAVLAFYTDGLTEFARDISAAEKTMAAAVSKLVGDTTVTRPAVVVQQAVLGANAPRDDVAVLIAQFSSVDAEVVPTDPASLVKEWRLHSSDAHAARASRHELMKFVRRFATDPDSVYRAELVLGEILANTVEHAPGLVEIQINWTGLKPIVTVRDTGPGLDRLVAELPSDMLSARGRGLFLIKSLAEDVTVKRAAGYGTELRAVLPVVRRL